MADIHYKLRASERDAEVPVKVVLDFGWPVEKRPRYIKKDERKITAIKYFDHVHIFTTDLKKRITVVPYSRRKWKFAVK